MTLNRSVLPGIALAAGLALCTVAGPAIAADPAPAAAAPAASTAPPKVLGLTEIENRLAAEGIRIKEIELRDKLLEVEGYDAQNRKVELIVDRRSGEILSRRFDH